MDNREADYNPHPPSCTCVECTAKRNGIPLPKRNEKQLLDKCPKCGENSLWNNRHEHKYECLNLECKSTFQESVKEESNSATEPQQSIKAKTSTMQLPFWFLSLLLIFIPTFIGLSLSLLINSNIPIIITFTFGLFYSFNRWLAPKFGKNKPLGKTYKTILNLAVLWHLYVLISSAIKVFSQSLVSNAFIGGLILITEFILFLWLCKLLSKNNWRYPSMSLTVFWLVIVFVVLAFAGVSPFSAIKDNVLSGIKGAFSQVQSSTNNYQEPTITPNIPLAITPIVTPIPTLKIPETFIPLNINSINSRTGVYKNYQLGLVKAPDGVLSGNNCFGEFIILINNLNAVNPTYSELVKFLKTDNTDQFPYQYNSNFLGSYYGTAESHIDLNLLKMIIDGVTEPNHPQVCADYAERLHNNAEKAGIRCAYVSINLSGYSDPYNYGIPSDSGHALTAFQTTDKGLIYIDCTNSPGPSRSVTTVSLEKEKLYIPISIFPESGWESTYQSMGTVTNVYITWDGNWN